jgi:DNA-binding response OmpR family regulator
LPPILTWGDLCLDPSSCEVTYGESRLNLSPTEYRLLEFFLRHPQRVFSRSQILDYLWSADQIPEESTIKAHIRGLRQKLNAAGVAPDIIETIYGLGYRLKEKPAI